MIYHFPKDSTIHNWTLASQGMASDRARAPQHAPKIILGVLLSRNLDIKLVLIFKLQH